MTSSRFTAPICGASAAVAADPMIEPSVPPTPMNPNSRLACSLRNTSAMRHQKIDVLNSANTVVQTKNARPIQTSTVDPSAARHEPQHAVEHQQIRDEEMIRDRNDAPNRKPHDEPENIGLSSSVAVSVPRRATEAS